MDYILESPYPDLPMRLGTKDQARYPVEPVKPLPFDAGVPTKSASESNGVAPPTTFGPLYKAYYLPQTNYSPQRHLIFVRRTKGTIDHGLQRGNAAAYEKAKFNVLLHPNQDTDNNCEYGSGSDDWRDMKDHWKTMLRETAMWPQVKRAPTVVC